MHELKDLLEEKYYLYNRSSFIEGDPISVPHDYSQKENIEIASFLTATIAWGNRKSIIRDARKLMAMMDHDPYDFIMNAGDKDFNSLNAFYHRTFCGIDTIYFLKALSNIYRNLGGLETLFTKEYIRKGDIRDSLIKLREIFFGSEHPARTEKHLADIRKGASAKRLNMFLRWMVRKDHGEVDFGLWSRIPSSALYIPLDVHSGSTARDLGILKRKQNDWNAVCELTFSLKELDPSDPVKYDFALFGIGAFEKTASKREYDAK